ncbi:MAG: YaiI/YqxD family protein [Spirochaetes bacterium]|nr:YaiI/YqxD family protein [Spirochaetota bacterium]
MRIFVDADAVPSAVREIIFRAAERTGVNVILVANTPLKIPDSVYISGVVVSSSPDAADDYIASEVMPDDLVVTSDIPLAARAVEKNSFVIDFRGNLITDRNIQERLAVRNLMDDLRQAGENTDRQSSFSQRDRRNFANQLDKFFSKHSRKE